MAKIKDLYNTGIGHTLEQFLGLKENNISLPDLGKLEELTPMRNIIAHNNPITAKDLERLKVHARDWFAYMQYLKSQDS